MLRAFSSPFGIHSLLCDTRQWPRDGYTVFVAQMSVFSLAAVICCMCFCWHNYITNVHVATWTCWIFDNIFSYWNYVCVYEARRGKCASFGLYQYEPHQHKRTTRTMIFTKLFKRSESLPWEANIRCAAMNGLDELGICVRQKEMRTLADGMADIFVQIGT